MRSTSLFLAIKANMLTSISEYFSASFSWEKVIFVAEQVNLADPRAEDQDEFFFERRKLLLEAENQQVGVMRLYAPDRKYGPCPMQLSKN